MTKFFHSLTLVAVLAASPALALEPLNKEAHINESLVAGQVGDTIRKTCPSISAKMFTVLAQAERAGRLCARQGLYRGRGEGVSEGQDRKGPHQGLGAWTI